MSDSDNWQSLFTGTGDQEALIRSEAYLFFASGWDATDNLRIAEARGTVVTRLIKAGELALGTLYAPMVRPFATQPHEPTADHQPQDVFNKIMSS